MAWIWQLITTSVVAGFRVCGAPQKQRFSAVYIAYRNLYFMLFLLGGGLGAVWPGMSSGGLSPVWCGWRGSLQLQTV